MDWTRRISSGSGSSSCGKPNVADAVFRALGDIDRDVNLLLVGRDRNLGRIDLKLEVTAICVIAAQRLEVAFWQAFCFFEYWSFLVYR